MTCTHRIGTSLTIYGLLAVLWWHAGLSWSVFALAILIGWAVNTILLLQNDFISK